MKFKPLEDNILIDDCSTVILTETGNLSQVLYLEKIFKECPIKVLPNKCYLLKSTGEIKNFKINSDFRLSNYDSLLRSFKNLEQIINTNITNAANVRFITLTYKENMQDTKRLYKDFESFMKTFKIYLQKKYNISDDEYRYINICEPQERGAWHCHLLLIFDNKAPYIPNKALFCIWQKGFVSIKQLKGDIDDFGKYFVAYFTDMEINENNFIELLGEHDLKDLPKGYGIIQEKEVIDDKGKKVKKQFVKGGRLPYYPAGFRMYRLSRNIKRPKKEKMSYKKAKEKIGSDEPIKSRSFELIDESDKIINKFRKDIYKSFARLY